MTAQLSEPKPVVQPAAPSSVASRLPGLVLCAIAAVVGLGVTKLVPAASPLLVAIILGVLAANLHFLPPSRSGHLGLLRDHLRPGLAFASRPLLRVGVALLGLQLALTDVAALGPGMLVVIVAVVTIGITATMALGKLLKIGRTQRLLIACGFSICGAAAVAAVEGVEDADETEVATAVGLVVVFGTLMIPTIPLLGRVLGLTELQTGLWAGASIHEVAQVVAAGGVIGATALGAAVVVKLGRVLMLAPVLAVLSVRKRRMLGDAADIKRPPLVPIFVLGFIALVLVRTTGVVPAEVVGGAKVVQTVLLAMAMFALGCGVRLAQVRSMGIRPMVLAAASTVIVVTTGLTGVLLVS